MRFNEWLFRRLNLEERILMAISAAFQAQLDRLNAFNTQLQGTIATLNASVAAADADDTAALSAALDTAGAPPAVAPAS